MTYNYVRWELCKRNFVKRTACILSFLTNVVVNYRRVDS